MTDSPEMPGPGYDAQTRPTGQPGTVNRTDSYGSAEHIPVAMTTDQLEDAKLGRALRELPGWWPDRMHAPRIYPDGPGWTIEGFSLYINDESLLDALTAARRELEDDR